MKTSNEWETFYGIQWNQTDMVSDHGFKDLREDRMMDKQEFLERLSRCTVRAGGNAWKALQELEGE